MARFYLPVTGWHNANPQPVNRSIARVTIIQSVILPPATFTLGLIVVFATAIPPPTPVLRPRRDQRSKKPVSPRASAEK